MQDVYILALAVTAGLTIAITAMCGLYAYVLYQKSFMHEAAITQRELIRNERARLNAEAGSSEDNDGVSMLIKFATDPNNAILLQQIFGQIQGRGVQPSNEALQPTAGEQQHG